jgi:hypothetical protein
METLVNNLKLVKKRRCKQRSLAHEDDLVFCIAIELLKCHSCEVQRKKIACNESACTCKCQLTVRNKSLNENLSNCIHLSTVAARVTLVLPCHGATQNMSLHCALSQIN